jgi:PAS domain S-box-containing protein/diguanylate cyclase (GGDEF)-like protein
MINGKKGKYFTLLLIAASGVILTLAVSFVAYNLEQRKVKALFSELSEYCFRYIEDKLGDCLDTLGSFRDFFSASASVERDEFDLFAGGIFLRQPYIFEFRWLPKVINQERPAFERLAQQEGLSSFSIKEIENESKLTLSGEREFYFPVYYVASSPNYKFDYSEILGLDAFSIPERRQAMEIARDTGNFASAAESRHFGEVEAKSATRVFIPIYKNGLPHTNIQQRRDNQSGFVSALFRFDDMVQSALTLVPLAGVDIAIFDRASKEAKPFYFHPARTRKTQVEYSSLKNPPGGLSWSAPLKFANRDWLVVCTPSPEFLAEHKIIISWVILFVGLALTSVLTLYLRALISREKQVKLLVQERTDQLRRLEERYRVLYESSRDAIMTLEPPAWNFTAGNAATIKLFAAKDEQEFVSKAPWELSPEFQPDAEPSAAKAKRMIDTAMQKGSHFFEWAHKRLNGEEFPATVLLTRVKLADKVFLQATVRDVTKEKQAEEALARANQQWQDTFNSISDFVFILDSESRILNVNQAFLRVMKLSRQEVIGKKCYEIVHKTREPWPNCPHQKTVQDLKAHTEKVDDPGLGLPLLVSTSPIVDEKGELYGSVHIAKDISDIIRRENELKAAKEELEIEAWGLGKANEGIKMLYKEIEAKNAQLQKVDQLKSDFVSSVSHELRTPLAIMKEGVSLVLDKVTGEINPKQEKSLQAVYTNINRLAQLINDLLDISKIEAGKIQLKKSLTDICALLKDTVSKWETEAARKNQQLSAACPAEQINIYLDPDKIVQVINNLVSNAIKFTPEQGKIEAGLIDHQDKVEVFVADSGMGIPDEDKAKVFGKFEQFSRAPGAGAKGTGLGLAITKELINLHEGSIKFDSRFNTGTRFTFYLPKIDSETIFVQHIKGGIDDVKRENSRLSLIVFKVKEFPRIQRELGVDKTRSLLKDIEGVINATLRRKSDTVVRDTGELIILLFDVDREKAVFVQERVKEAICDFLGRSAEQFIKNIDLSVGIASYPDQAANETQLLARAREKMAGG